MGTNCYLIINEETKELVIVDPATCPDYVVSHVKSNGYIPKAIFLTHAHFDHVMGINAWVKEFGIPVYLHEEEKEILAKANLNLSYQFGKNYTYEDVEKQINDYQIIINKLNCFCFSVAFYNENTNLKETLLWNLPALYKISSCICSTWTVHYTWAAGCTTSPSSCWPRSSAPAASICSSPTTPPSLLTTM